MSYSTITIIFNPNSTGSGKEMAQELQSELKKRQIFAKVIPTNSSGHAEKLAYDAATSSAKALVISASGDGGYHEVVNGLMRAQEEGAKPVAGLLPAGNANDHFHSVHGMDVAESINNSSEQSIDVLVLTGQIKGKPYKRYAHSYIGLGMTPKIGKELNKKELNWLNEKWIVIKALIYLKPVRILLGGKVYAFYSLIFSNIDRMSKVMSLSENAKSNDRKFEITSFDTQSKLKLLGRLIKASTIGLEGKRQVNEYEFRTIKPTILQLDGEVITVDASTDVTICINYEQLRCLK